MADEKAIEEAQKELDEYNNQKAIDAIDDEIQAWKDYKKTWDDIPSDFEKMQNALIAQELLGKDAEADILNQRMDTFNDFKNGYLKVLQDIEDATKRANEAQQKLNLTPTTTATTSGGSGSGSGGGSYNGGGATTGGATTVVKPTPQGNFVNFKTDKDLRGYWLEVKDLAHAGTRGGAQYVALKGTRYYKWDDTKQTMSIAGILAQQHNHMQNTVAEKYVPSSKIFRTATTKGGANKMQTRASGSPYIGRSGIYNVDENGKELAIHNPARGRYTFLQHGDGILNAGLTRNIMALANNPELAIQNVLGRMLASNNNTTTNTQSQIINISNINLPNVDNATQFIKQLQLISQNH